MNAKVEILIPLSPFEIIDVQAGLMIQMRTYQETLKQHELSAEVRAAINDQLIDLSKTLRKIGSYSAIAEAARLSG